jgi:uncharacterized protein
MKKLLLLLLCVPLMFSCGEKKESSQKEEKLQTIDTTYANGDRYVGEWKDGKRHGKGMEILNSGVKSEGKYKNGIKDGPWKSYYKNGQLKSEENYSSDSIQTIDTKVYPKNIIHITQPISPGHKSGLCKFYYKSGELESEQDYYGNFTDAKFYYINGKLKSKGSFYNGDKVDYWDYYYENGQFKSKELWLNGKLTFSKCWDIEGNEIDCE